MKLILMKEMEGMVEKDYTMVLYADNKFSDKGLPSYHFNLVQEGTSAKCPPDIFGAEIQKVENDANEVLNKILTFVNH